LDQWSRWGDRFRFFSPPQISGIMMIQIITILCVCVFGYCYHHLRYDLLKNGSSHEAWNHVNGYKCLLTYWMFLVIWANYGSTKIDI
jgi:hypothetical protein